jgi:type IV secretion system protein VirB10
MMTPDIGDPRADPEIAIERDIRPVVERPRGGPSGLAIGIGALLAALILFFILDAHRRALLAPATQPRTELAAESAAPPPLYIPPEPIPTSNSAPIAVPAPTPSATPLAAEPLQPVPIAYPPLPTPIPTTPVAPPRNFASPAVVVDNGAVQPAPGTGQNAAKPPSPGAADLGGADRARAAMFADRSTTVPQGTLIPAVLETGLDSSHAGFARALVQRNVRGFDGARVLIPRGSRLIGEYGSDVSQGQKRAFIAWNRLIRPDGVTIAINSPAADPVGRGGVRADVNSHFFARFTGAILQSVLDVGVNLASRSSHSPVVVALPGSFQGTTSTVTQPAQIAPTLKVKPGTSISVFVARDLDFNGANEAEVGP